MSEHAKASTAQKTNTAPTSSQPKNSPVTQDSHPSALIQRARLYPESLSHADMMQLQRTIGNQAVIQLLKDADLMRPVQESEPVQAKARQPENNTGLPDSLKSGVESLSGMDMDNVRVHYNSDKPAQVGALAYTQGTDIHVAPGQERHLPHEAWHVVQQAQGRVSPTMQLEGMAVNDDAALEREADEMGARGLQLKKDDGDTLANNNMKNTDALSAASVFQPIIQGVFFEIWEIRDDTDKSKLEEATHKYYVPPEALLANIKGAREAAAAIKSIGEDGLLKYLRALDTATFHDRKALLNRLKTDTRTGFNVLTRIEFIQRMGYDNDIINRIFRGFESVEFKYKLALCSACGLKDEADKTLSLLGEIIPRFGKTIEPEGVIGTLADKFTTTWEREPDYYLEGTGQEQLEGFKISLQGVNAELEAIYNASQIGPESGEYVFSSSEYTDAEHPEIKEDVDVSFIDSAGFLNLIEVGFNLHVIKNKLSGSKLREQDLPDGQKQRYQYMASRSHALTHEPKGTLKGKMAADRQIRGILFFYSVPEAAFRNSVYTEEGIIVLKELVRNKAGLMVGAKRYTLQDLDALIEEATKIVKGKKKRLFDLEQELFSRRTDQGGGFYNAYEDLDDRVLLGEDKYEELLRLREDLK